MEANFESKVLSLYELYQGYLAFINVEKDTHNPLAWGKLLLWIKEANKEHSDDFIEWFYAKYISNKVIMDAIEVIYKSLLDSTVENRN